MYSEPSPERRFPKVPLDRRAYAFLLDFVLIWILSSFSAGFSQAIVFFCLLVWTAGCAGGKESGAKFGQLGF